MNMKGVEARVTLYGRDVLDDRGPNTAFTVASYPTLWAFAAAREPLTYGVRLRFEF